MNIYILSRSDKIDYDEYDAFVVVAESSEQAMEYTRSVHPKKSYDDWSDDVEALLIGTTDKYDEPLILLGSFNAG